jgi:hypothetical protein
MNSTGWCVKSFRRATCRAPNHPAALDRGKLRHSFGNGVSQEAGVQYCSLKRR